MLSLLQSSNDTAIATEVSRKNIKNHVGSPVKVSVIIPVFNAEDYLDATLESIKNQTLRNIEIICINDGSSDGSLDILRAHLANDNSIRVVNNSENCGTGYSINIGFDLAAGEYIQIVGSDDLLVPHALEFLYNFCEEHQLDFCQYAINVINDDPADEFLHERMRVKQNYHQVNHDYGITSGIDLIIACTKNDEYRMTNGPEIVKRSLIEAGARNLEGYQHEDMYYTYRLMMDSKRATLLRDELYVYRVHYGSIETTKLDRLHTGHECLSLVVSAGAMIAATPREVLNSERFEPVVRREIDQFVTIAKNRYARMPKKERTIIVGSSDPYVAALVPVFEEHARKTANKEFPAPEPVKVSVIVPVFNSEDCVTRTIESVLAQDIDPQSLELILVDDGSTDESLAVCQQHAAADERVRVVHQANSGVSSARNTGMNAARGTYIAFLDSDDTLAPDTLREVCAFFDEHYDEIDLTTYPMRIHVNGKMKSHIRETVLRQTGVYDLSKLENAYALVTNVNVVVKNTAETPRFDTKLSVHEDLQFMLNVLLRKQAVGFCKNGGYHYDQHPGSTIDAKMHPFYQFENNIGFWEELFARYPGKAPIYLQASFLNEIRWKIPKDLVLPRHYDAPARAEAENRLRKLLSRVDDDVIFSTRLANEYTKMYFASLKKTGEISCNLSDSGFTLMRGPQLLLCRNRIDMVIFRTCFQGDAWVMRGVLRSPAFPFTGQPQLIAYCDNLPEPLQAKIQLSSCSYHIAHFPTAVFWNFEFLFPFTNISDIVFELNLDGFAIPLKLIATERCSFNSQNNIFSFEHAGSLFTLSPETQGISIQHKTSHKQLRTAKKTNDRAVWAINRKAWGMRQAAKHAWKTRPIWLYYDRTGVGKDNAYYQFIHDFEINDGIDRYYVTDDSSELLVQKFSAKQRKHVLPFSSNKHRLFHLQADKIIAAYIEPANWRPFRAAAMNRVADLVHYELIYLQHGVLHAHMPWKYSADRLLMDREVISTTFEAHNLERVYGFMPDQLIHCGMPRYDFIDHEAVGTKRILFAPSWRKYLMSETSNLQFVAKPGALDASTFWQETRTLLQNPNFTELLRTHDYQLDIKLHPIFNVYRNKFARFENDCINLVDSVNENTYSLFITDYSSWVFDFVYRCCKIAYFLPDEAEFKAGLNGYFQLDLPLEKGFGPLAKTANSLIENLEYFFAEGSFGAEYETRMDSFFLHYDNNQRDRLYQALINQ